MAEMAEMAEGWTAKGGSSRAKSLIWICVLVGSLLSLSSCVPHQLHRPLSVVKYDDFTQVFVEIDDQGELWSPRQLELALDVLEDASHHPKGALVNIFVHGWNHDASAENEIHGGNIRGQQRLLSLIADSRPPEEYPQPVIGIYIAWRGKLLRGPLNMMSFFNRRQAANRVAGITATSTVYRLLSAAKHNSRSRVVLIGHSFGGLVVERTLSQALIGSLFAPGAEHATSFDFPADLVVLLNPASPAIHAKQFVESLERNRLKLYREDNQGIRREMPLVVSLTSEGDWATGVFYPLGLNVLAGRKAYREYGSDYCGANASQKSFTVQTAGHHTTLHSHRVTAEPLSSVSRDDRLRIFEDSGSARWIFDPVTQQPVIQFEGENHLFKIKRRLRAFNDTPYWIMRVPKSLIPDHAQVFHFNAHSLIAALMTATGALDPESRTRLRREDGIRPLGLATTDRGEILFLDRSRRLYRVPEKGGHPRFFSCLPSELDPQGDIGLAYEDGEYISAIRQRRRSRGSAFNTSFRVVRVHDERVEVVDTRNIRSERRFVSMTADVPGRQGFLVEEDSNVIWQVDLTEHGGRRPEPFAAAVLEHSERVTLLAYQSGEHALFAIDGKGTVYRVDLGTGIAQWLVDGLGWPTALEYDKWRRRLYIADALNRRVWRFDCDEACAVPELHVDCQSLQHPTTLRVMPDGKLWIGDLQAQALVRTDVEGKIERTYLSLVRGPIHGKPAGF